MLKLNNQTTLTPEQFVEFLKRCEDVEMDSITKLVSFTYFLRGDEYQYECNYYDHSDESVLARIDKEIWQELECDEDRREYIQELFDTDSGRDGNYETVGWQTDFYEEHLYDYESEMAESECVTWVEIYPYDGGICSGEFDVEAMAFESWQLQQCGEPCGAPAESYVVVPDRVLEYVKNNL